VDLQKGCVGGGGECANPLLVAAQQHVRMDIELLLFLALSNLLLCCPLG
jgi:hypothetical protein